MGADRAILVRTEPRSTRSRSRAIIAKVASEEKPDLVMIGKQAIDDDSNQVGQMIAEMLGWPQATFASKVEIAGEKCTVVREVDGGLETIAFPAAGGGHRRLAPQRAALCLAAGDHEGAQEAAQRNRGRQPRRGPRPEAQDQGLKAPAKRQAGRKVGSVQELVEVSTPKRR